MSDRSSTCFWFKGLVYSKLSADVSRLGRGPCYDVVVCDLEPTQGGVGTREEPALLVEINVGVHFTPLKI